MTKILLIGKSFAVISGVKAHLDATDCETVQTVSTDAAIQMLQVKRFHAVVLSGTVSSETRRKIESIIAKMVPSTHLIVALSAADAIKAVDAIIVS